MCGTIFKKERKVKIINPEKSTKPGSILLELLIDSLIN